MTPATIAGMCKLSGLDADRYLAEMEQMEQDCEAMFQTDEKAFALECFDFIRSADGQEESHVYRQAFRDCVLVLKWMGVLA